MNQPTVNEISSRNTVVRTLIGYDPDANDELTYSLDSTSDGRFALNSSAAVCKSRSFGVSARAFLLGTFKTTNFWV